MSLGILTAFFILLFWRWTSHGLLMSIHFVWQIKIVYCCKSCKHLLYFVLLYSTSCYICSAFLAFLIRETTTKKCFFCYFDVVSNIRKTKKLWERDSYYGLTDCYKDNFFYFYKCVFRVPRAREKLNSYGETQPWWLQEKPLGFYFTKF